MEGSSWCFSPKCISTQAAVVIDESLFAVGNNNVHQNCDGASLADAKTYSPLIRWLSRAAGNPPRAWVQLLSLYLPNQRDNNSSSRMWLRLVSSCSEVGKGCGGFGTVINLVFVWKNVSSDYKVSQRTWRHVQYHHYRRKMGDSGLIKATKVQMCVGAAAGVAACFHRPADSAVGDVEVNSTKPSDTTLIPQPTKMSPQLLIKQTE